MQPKLSERERYLLDRLCRCEYGKGILLEKQDSRIGHRLVNKGLADILGCNLFSVLKANHAGRALLLGRVKADEQRAEAH